MEKSLKFTLPEDGARAADVKHSPSPATWAVPTSKSRTGALLPPLHPRWVVLGRLGPKSLFDPTEPRCLSWTSRTCARLGWWLKSLPTAGIAHQSAGANGKRAKVWTQPWGGWLHAKADLELARRHVCVDITKGSSLLIPSQSAHGAYFGLKDMRLFLLSGNTIKNILFSSWVLARCVWISACECERLSTGKCDLSKYVSID